MYCEWQDVHDWCLCPVESADDRRSFQKYKMKMERKEKIFGCAVTKIKLACIWYWNASPVLYFFEVARRKCEMGKK